MNRRTARRPFCCPDQPHKAKGLCALHYGRWLRTGEIHLEVPRQPRTRAEQAHLEVCGCEVPDVSPIDDCRRCHLPVLEALLARPPARPALKLVASNR